MNASAGQELPPIFATVRLVLGGEPITDRRREVVVQALAVLLELAPEEIVVQEVRAGSVSLALPAAAAKRLQALLRADNRRLALLKLAKVAIEWADGTIEEWAFREGQFALAQVTRPKQERMVRPLGLRLFAPFVVALMVGCLVWSVVELVQLFAPDWSGSYLLVIAVLAAVEAHYSHRIIRAHRVFGSDVYKFRVVELVLFFILLRVGGLLGQDWGVVWAELQSWPHEPWRVIGLESTGAFVVVLLAWAAATASSADLERLGEPPERSADYVPPMQGLAGRFFAGGGVLVLLSGLAIIGRSLPEGATDWRTVALLARTRHTDLALNVLLYFVLGLVMLGQVQLSLMQRRWQADNVPVDRTLAGRWSRLSLLLVGLAAGLAFLLPTGYSAGLLQAASGALAWLSAAITYLVSFILFLFAMLLAPLLSWIFGRAGPREATPRPRFEPPPLATTTPGVTPDWVLLMRSVLFWALLLAGVLFVVRAYLQDHPEVAASLARLRPLRALQNWWVALLGWLHRWRKRVRLRLPRPGWRRPVAGVEPARPRRLIRLGALSPRERILYYYWSVLRRAEAAGLPRRPADTPNEYRATLKSRLARTGEEVDQLTETFVEARYSPRPVSDGREKEARVSWQAVRRALQALRKRGGSE